MLFALSCVVLVLLVLLAVSHWKDVAWLWGLSLLAMGMAIVAAWQANRAFYVMHHAAPGILWTFAGSAFLLYGIICLLVRHN